MTFWWEIITQTHPIHRGVWDFPNKFHLYLIEDYNYICVHPYFHLIKLNLALEILYFLSQIFFYTLIAYLLHIDPSELGIFIFPDFIFGAKYTLTQIHTDKQTNRQTNKHTLLHSHNYLHTDKQTNRQNKETHYQTLTQLLTHRQTNKQTNRQTHSHSLTQLLKHKQTDKQTNTLSYTHTIT